MKSFKTLLSEVAEPKSAEEKRFKDQHTYEVIKHPVALDSQHTGEITPGQTTDKGKRAADQKGDAAYDKAYSKHGDGSTKLKEDASGMNAAQKMNFDKLYKKMNNGPEHKALKQKHGNQVKADDAFHAMVKAKAMGEDQQLTDEELSAAQKKIDINKNGKIDGHDLAMLRAKMKTTRNVNKDDRGYDKIRTNESDELLDEGMKFKQGNLKLKDRSSVKITKEDADKLNKLMGGLDRNNLKRMEATAVKDKKSFNEILSFAREAT